MAKVGGPEFRLCFWHGCFVSVKVCLVLMLQAMATHCMSNWISKSAKLIVLKSGAGIHLEPLQKFLSTAQGCRSSFGSTSKIVFI